MKTSFIATADLPTAHGVFKVHAFSAEGGHDHVAITAGIPQNPCLLRIHSECATGDIFSSLRCDCRPQLEAALVAIAETNGMIIYLRGHEGRGIGLANKIRAYALQDKGYDTIDANTCLGLPIDSRDYTVAADILRHFQIDRVSLLTNNQKKVTALEDHGITIIERRPLWVAVNPHNKNYMATKRQRMGHL
jgi:3,4-dihydroxy 2-butanone 4-phosphate synthase / GTP cyclohydrolase II